MQSDLTVGQTAEQLQIHDQSVLKLIAAGELEAVDVGAGSRPRYRIPQDAIDKFKRRRRVGPEAKASPRRRLDASGKEYV